MPVGDAAGSFLGGLLQGKAQGREQKVKNAYVDAQKTHVKKQSDALQAQIEMEAMKSDILKNMTPEQRQMALYPKSADPSENLKKILDMLGGGTASPPPAPASLPFGGGTQNFPLDPSLTAPAPPTLPDQIAKGQMGGFQIDSIDTGTGAPRRFRTRRGNTPGAGCTTAAGPRADRSAVTCAMRARPCRRFTYRAFVANLGEPVDCAVRRYKPERLADAVQPRDRNGPTGAAGCILDFGQDAGLAMLVEISSAGGPSCGLPFVCLSFSSCRRYSPNHRRLP